MKKPSFNVSPDGKTVEVDGTVYDLTPQKTGSFYASRQYNFGEGFEMADWKRLLKFLSAVYQNQDKKEAEKLVYPNSKLSFHANTILYRGEQLTYAIDNPIVKGREVLIDEEILTSRISNKAGNIFSSEDGLVRAIESEILEEEARSLKTEKESLNSFLVSGSDYFSFLAGYKEAGQDISRILDITRRKISISPNISKGYVSAPDFWTLDESIFIVNNFWAGGHAPTYSFKFRKAS